MPYHNTSVLSIATVFGLTEYFFANATKLSLLFLIAILTAVVVLAHPCNTCLNNFSLFGNLLYNTPLQYGAKQIEKQLNKVELANRFTRAVAIGSPREFMQAEKEEQEIAESCNRLIKNCVICWNYLYLTHRLIYITDQVEKEQLLKIISTHSIMTWAHINMIGEYDFSEEKRKDSVGILPPKTAA